MDPHLTDNIPVSIIHLDTGEIITTNTINPDKTSRRNNEKEPGREPGSSS